MVNKRWLAVHACLALALGVPAQAETLVSLTFDDGLAEQLLVPPMLAPHDMRASFFVISARVGTRGYFTLQQLRALHEAGHEVGGHTLHHEELATLLPDMQREEVCEDRTRLLIWGLPVTSLAYPFGSDDEAVHKVVEACGYSAARDVRGLRDTCGSCPAAESVPPANPFELRTAETVTRDHSLETMQSWVLAAEEAGGGWVPLVFHFVLEDCTGRTYCVTPSTLRALIDWLAARAPLGTHVRTVREVVGGEERPAMHARPRPADALLKNASLLEKANGDGVPDCWQLGGRGADMTLAWETQASAGVPSVVLSDETATAGARQLAVLRDDGTCAPLLPEGEGRRVGVWYQSNMPVHLIVSFRSADGRWGPWLKGPAWPASEVPAQATWDVPRPPPGTVGLSVGVAQDGPGWMRLGSFSLEEAPLPPPITPPDLTDRAPNVIVSPPTPVDSEGDAEQDVPARACGCPQATGAVLWPGLLAALYLRRRGARA
ncbi:MAG: polysaccharide deacetylase family protein [Myxococcaceae bacterium]